MTRKPIFDAVRKLLGRPFTQAEVTALDWAIDEAEGAIIVTAPAPERKVSQKGIDLMHRWEGCELDAYPDPGSDDGNPWTVGYGATGPGIERGVRWTQAECDERFERDLEKYARQVSKVLGNAPTTQDQFDALVAWHYNTGAIATATLTKKHKAGDYEGAAREFRRWNRNDGRVMRGLTNRRADEEKLYRGQA